MSRCSQEVAQRLPLVLQRYEKTTGQPGDVMSNDEIRQTLTRLHQELENAEHVEPELKTLLEEVDADIHKLLGTTDQPPDGLNERVDELVAQFAASHPGADRFLRELVDSLGKLGI